MNITVDTWNYEQWRTRMAFKLSQWKLNGIRLETKPEYIELSATQPRDILRIGRHKRTEQAGK